MFSVIVCVCVCARVFCPEAIGISFWIAAFLLSLFLRGWMSRAGVESGRDAMDWTHAGD